MAFTLNITLNLNNSQAVVRGLGDVGNQVKHVGNDVKNSSDQISNGMGAIGNQLNRMRDFAIGFVIFDKLKEYAGKAIALADEWTILNGKMLLANGTAEKATVVTEQLYQMSQNLRVPLTDTASLYSRIVPALKEYGGGSAEALRITEALALSLKVSNATQAESASAMLQFSQAMSAGALRGEEFNAMADAAPRLLVALAEGMGKTRGELKGLAEQGALTTDVVYAALSKQLPKLQEEFGRLPMTVGDAWTKLGNTALKTIGQLNDGGGFTEVLAKGIDGLAESLPHVVSVIQLSFISMIGRIQIGWADIKYFSLSTWAELQLSFVSGIDDIRAKFGTFVGLVANAMRIIPGLDSQVAQLDAWRAALQAPSASVETLKNKLRDLTAAHKSEVNAIDDLVDASFADAAQREKVTAATQNQQKAADSLKVVHRLSADEQRKLTTTAEKLKESIDQQVDALNRNITGQTKMSETEKVAADIQEFLTKQGKNLTATEKAYYQGKLQLLPQLQAQANAQKTLTDKQDAYTKKLQEGLQTLKDNLEKAQLEQDAIGKTDAQIRKLSITRDRETLAMLEAREMREGCTEALDKEIEIMRERIKVGTSLDAQLSKNEGLKKQAEQIKANTQIWSGFMDDVGKNFGDGFQRMLETGKGSWTSFTDSIKNTFSRSVVDYINQTLAKPFLLKLTTSMAGGAVSAGAGAAGGGGGAGGVGALGSMGMWGLVAAGAVVAANVWNKSQAEKLKEYSSSYVQSKQNRGTVLGDANAQSDSATKALTSMSESSKNLLDVNYGMYRALLAIQDGIAGTASGFAKQIGLNGSGVQGLKTGVELSNYANLAGNVNYSKVTKGLGGGSLDKAIGGFLDGISSKISSALYNSKTSISDSGISIGAANLGDLMNGGTLNAENYAVVKNVKKILGVNAGQSVKTKTSELDDVTQEQFSSVFVSAGAALKEAAKAFGKDGDEFVKTLKVDSQKLSLKGLSGDALTKQIEAFFSTNLDKWSQMLVADSDTLKQFQEIGEGAFQTVVRLGTQINTFTDYTEKLHLNFKLVGFDAIRASQAIADAAGGFDVLTSNLQNYYDNFFSEDERTFNQMLALKGEFTKLGIDVVPETREQFRALVESLDLSTEAGQKEFASLIQLSGAFADLVPETEAVVQNILNLTPEMNKYSALLGGGFAAAFANVTDSSMASLQALVDFSGGLDSLTQKLDYYYENFFSDAEKGAVAFAELDAKLDRLGVTVELSKEGFRGLLDPLDPAKNPEMYAGLLDLAPLFDQVIKSAAGQTIGKGIDAQGVTDNQLNSINQSADSWWSTYQPEMQKQTDEAAKTTAAILALTDATKASSESVRAEVANSNATLESINTGIQQSIAASEYIASAVTTASKQTSTAVETAVVSGSRL